jgi:Peptidase family M28
MKKIKIFHSIVSFLTFLSVIFLSSCGPDKSAEETNNKGSEEQTTPQKPHVDPPVFSSDSAYNFVKTQCDFGPRAPGSKAHEQCANWMEAKLKSYGANVIMQKATLTTYDQKKWLCKNIIAEFNPDATDRVLLMAHWDSRPMADHDSLESDKKKPILGANDGASGVGVLIEVARALASKKPNIGIDILLVDLEDYGDPSGDTDDSWCLGTQYWSKNLHKQQYYAKYGICLDMVGAKDAVFPKEGSSVNYARTIVDKVWKKAQDMGYGNYFADAQTSPTVDDHVYVNMNTSIPTIDIVHYDNAKRSYFPCHHKQCDNMDNIDKKTLESVGKLLLELIYNE